MPVRFVICLALVLLMATCTNALIDGHRAIVRENSTQHGLPPGNPHAVDCVK